MAYCAALWTELQKVLCAAGVITASQKASESTNRTPMPLTLTHGMVEPMCYLVPK